MNLSDDDVYEVDVDDEETLCEYRRCFCDDVNFLSRYGPLNPQKPREGEILFCAASPRGRCAMMTCDCHDDENDWYSGNCDYCGTDIDAKNMAMRIPMYYGGFKGCYCSKKCMHLVFSENTHSFEHILIEIMCAYLQEYPIVSEQDVVINNSTDIF